MNMKKGLFRMFAMSVLCLCVVSCGGEKSGYGTIVMPDVATVMDSEIGPSEKKVLADMGFYDIKRFVSQYYVADASGSSAPSDEGLTKMTFNESGNYSVAGFEDIGVLDVTRKFEGDIDETTGGGSGRLMVMEVADDFQLQGSCGARPRLFGTIVCELKFNAATRDEYGTDGKCYSIGLNTYVNDYGQAVDVGFDLEFKGSTDLGPSNFKITEFSGFVRIGEYTLKIEELSEAPVCE